ncbi:MAG: hypothetical protein ACYS15_16555 [Planctomycetota bacterium]|jgi:hypothetical protein
MIIIRQTGFAIAAALVLGSLALAVDPIIGPQVRVDVTGGPEWANETTASASELFPDRVVAGWNDHREGPGSRFGVALSLDGGSTWTDFLIRPPAAFEGPVEGDPMVAHDDRTGTLWAGAMSFWEGGGIYVARLEPGDTSFQRSVMAEHGLVDKGWMAAGPRYGSPESTRLYCAYNLGIIWSDDMGETWTDPVPLGSGAGFLPRVGPNGEVYVSYWDWGTGVWLKRSLDGGHTITSHLIATRMDVWGVYDTDRFPGIFRVPSFTYLEVDPNSGALYALYFDTTNYVDGQANVDLYFAKSVDQGTTWSVPVVINDDADPPGDQFFPWIEVDQEGRIHVVFLDSRNVVQDDDVPHGFFDAYYTHSDDGGQTWNEYRLTRDSWNSAGINFLGDYSGMAVAGNTACPVYVQVDGGDPRIYANVIEFPADCPWDCAEPADGAVDIVDFLALLAQWGQAGTSCDVNGGGVDVTDFLELLANWGPCP